MTMPDDTRQQIETYKALMQRAEELNRQIDALFQQYQGGTHRMPEEALAHYRQLAQERDEVHSELSALERQLFGDDETHRPRKP